MFKYTPKNPSTKRMKAHDFLITQEGFSTLHKIPALDALVLAGVLEIHEEDTAALEAKAKKEAQEAKEATQKALDLKKAADEAQKEADKENSESQEAQENLEKAKPSRRSKKKNTD